MEMLIERVTIFCDTCGKKIISRKGRPQRHGAAMLKAVNAHKEQPGTHELRSKIDAVY